MSYIYKIDGSVIKTKNIIEHFNVCIKGICLTDEKKNDKCPSAPAPIIQYSHIKECPTCTSCDSVQCPVTRPCPVCDDVLTLPEDLIDSKITEPYIIKEIIDTTNIVYLTQEYLQKLNQFNINFIKKYILYSNFEDVKRLMETFNFLKLDYIHDLESSTSDLLINPENMNLINKYSDGVINSYDLQKLIPEDIEIYFKNKKFINPPKNIEKIKSYNIIDVHYEPKNLIDNSQDIDKKFMIKGKYKIEFYDLQINDSDYRYLSIYLNDEQNQIIFNALEFHIPFQVSLNNNNLPPEYVKKNQVLTMAKIYLQKLFIKPDFESYIYFEKEYSKSLIDVLKQNIESIEYNEQETNILISEIDQNRENEINKFKFLINPNIYGNILDINKSFKFTFHNKVYKSNQTNKILLEEIKDNRFFLTFDENWANLENEIKLDDILLIRKGDNDSAYAISDKYYNYWRVVDIYNSTFTLENMEYFDSRKSVDVDLNYEFVDLDGKLPMPNSLLKAKEILQIYNLDSYDIESIKKFGKTVSELTLSSSTRIEMKNEAGREYNLNSAFTSGRNLMEEIYNSSILIANSNDINILKTSIN